MRIGIDARELGGRPTGAGRYLGGLLRGDGRRTNERAGTNSSSTPARLGIELDSHRFCSTPRRGARPIHGGSRFALQTLPNATTWTCLFAPAYAIPLQLAVPAVVAIHDVSFMAHPEWFRMREGMRRRFLARHSASLARAIITISEFSRRELIDTLGAPDERIYVIPPGANRSSAPRPTSARVNGCSSSERSSISPARRI